MKNLHLRLAVKGWAVLIDLDDDGDLTVKLNRQRGEIR